MIEVLTNYNATDIDSNSIPLETMEILVGSLGSLKEALECSNLRAWKFGCLSVGDGTWLELRGGPFYIPSAESEVSEDGERGISLSDK